MQTKEEKKKLEQIAEAYLKQQYIKHVGMLQVIYRGTAQIIEANEQGVLLRDEISEVYMLSTTEDTQGIAWMKEHLTKENCSIMQVTSKGCMEFAKKAYGFKNSLDCKQMVYSKKEPVTYKARLKIVEPNEVQFQQIWNVYDAISYEELCKIRERHQLFVALYEGEMVGFIGSHLEGSIGLLKVLPEHRRRGYGLEMESYMINQFLEWGYIPFVQVEVGNKQSEALQVKLELETSDEYVYWIY